MAGVFLLDLGDGNDRCGSMNERQRWILIGEIAAPHGVRGAVRIKPHTDFPERFLEMEQIALFRSEVPDRPWQEMDVEDMRLHQAMVIGKLRGVDSRDAAEVLRGAQIRCREEELVDLPADSYYIFELVGLDVITTAGEHLGQIREVLRTGANDVYVIRPAVQHEKRAEILLPAIRDVVVAIELERGQITVSIPAGLLE